MQGLKRVINDPPHRNEVVAGSMSEYLTRRKWVCSVLQHFTHSQSEYREVLKKIPDESGDFYEALGVYRTQDRLSLSSILQEPLRELPQV